MDNNLDKIFDKVKTIRSEELAALAAKLAERKIEQKPIKVEKKIEPNNTEKKDPAWSQEQQKGLEAAIILFKDVKDPKEKWQKIAEKIPGKTMSIRHHLH